MSVLFLTKEENDCVYSWKFFTQRQCPFLWSSPLALKGMNPSNVYAVDDVPILFAKHFLFLHYRHQILCIYSKYVAFFFFRFQDFNFFLISAYIKYFLLGCIILFAVLEPHEGLKSISIIENEVDPHFPNRGESGGQTMAQ